MLRNETEHQAVGSKYSASKSCSVLSNGDWLHLHNRNLIFIRASEAVRLLRRLPIWVQIFLMPGRCNQQPKTRFSTCKTEVVHRYKRWPQKCPSFCRLPRGGCWFQYKCNLFFGIAGFVHSDMSSGEMEERPDALINLAQSPGRRSKALSSMYKR